MNNLSSQKLLNSNNKNQAKLVKRVLLVVTVFTFSFVALFGCSPYQDKEDDGQMYEELVDTMVDKLSLEDDGNFDISLEFVNSKLSDKLFLTFYYIVNGDENFRLYISFDTKNEKFYGVSIATPATYNATPVESENNDENIMEVWRALAVNALFIADYSLSAEQMVELMDVIFSTKHEDFVKEVECGSFSGVVYKSGEIASLNLYRKS